MTNPTDTTALALIDSPVWNGETDPDPLAFVLGTDYATGDPYRFAFTRKSPHMLFGGICGSGKTCVAENIAVQALTKPMPWDTDLFATVDIVDPKGDTARRWRGRRNVVVSHGQLNSGVEESVYDKDGNTVCEKTGVVVMAEHMDQILQEFQRRMQVLARYPEAGSWLDLPDDAKRDARLAPKIVVLDEFLNHTVQMPYRDPLNQAENEARQRIMAMTSSLLRGGANVGIHLIVVTQRMTMQRVDDPMVTNIPVRCLMGPGEPHGLTFMFGRYSRPVPEIPFDQDGHPRRGAGRIMTELGGPVDAVQFMRLGPVQDTDPLDEWLPRGETPVNGDFTVPAGAVPGSDQ